MPDTVYRLSNRHVFGVPGNNVLFGDGSRTAVVAKGHLDLANGDLVAYCMDPKGNYYDGSYVILWGAKVDHKKAGEITDVEWERAGISKKESDQNFGSAHQVARAERKKDKPAEQAILLALRDKLDAGKLSPQLLEWVAFNADPPLHTAEAWWQAVEELESETFTVVTCERMERVSKWQAKTFAARHQAAAERGIAV